MKVNYPIMLKLEGKKVVVVGGGKVAERKILGLLDTGAEITVISPKVTEKVERLAADDLVLWHCKAFSEEDLSGASLVFAATDDVKINHMVKTAAGPHQFVTIADDPEASDFHVPAMVTRGRLNIAVSTGGASPTLASRIRSELETQFDEGYESYLEFLYIIRQRILAEVKDPALKRKLLSAIVSHDFLNSDNREEEFQKLYNELV
ncbi:NAD(P)-binding protein [Neobacillus niacini]|uniref:NAD(P)-binding protein n=1 Tax=Neobacillus niacini TaxID=86668 RepID=UPI00285D69E4|nr:NAD(P)-binding protein [Neobacillus niacini]MDR7001988.1 precorrin-2 dehydrogenase/sirohydrochlorin ferrochelatase [Neobacillus niacini]